jgi:DNA-binding LacI/PurR family transcriptional regulator
MVEQAANRRKRARKRPSRPTLADVARLAGVSTYTVSKVVNSSDTTIPISKQTRKRVLMAVRQLSYEPNFIARSLATRRTKMIGMVVADIRDPYFGEMIRGVEETLHEAGYVYILSSANSKADLESFHADLFNQMRVDGILVAGLTSPSQNRAVLSLTAKGIPLVAMSSDFPPEKVPQVVLDYAQCMRIVMDHLLGLGHRRIAYIAGPSGERHNLLSIQGYKDALDAANIPFDRQFVLEGDYTPQEGRSAMARLIELKEPPTAVFCSQNIKAAGAIEALWEAGLNVPGGISVAALDSNDMCEYCSPPMTALKLPRFEMGASAARILLDLLKHPDQPARSHVVLEPRLIIRHSTASPPDDR